VVDDPRLAARGHVELGHVDEDPHRLGIGLEVRGILAVVELDADLAISGARAAGAQLADLDPQVVAGAPLQVLGRSLHGDREIRSRLLGLLAELETGALVVIQVDEDRGVRAAGTAGLPQGALSEVSPEAKAVAWGPAGRRGTGGGARP